MFRTNCCASYFFFSRDLEQYVGSLQKDPGATHRVVTLKDVEEGAVTLRKVGESLAGLKGKTTADKLSILMFKSIIWFISHPLTGRRQNL